jgi:hypothetical protein
VRDRKVAPPPSEDDPTFPTSQSGELDDGEPPDTTVVGRAAFAGARTRPALLAAGMLALGVILGAGGLGIWLWASGGERPPQAAVPVSPPAPPASLVAPPTEARAPETVKAPPLVVEAPAADRPRAPRAEAAVPAAASAIKPGYLTVASEPIYAVIYASGRRLGETPIVRYPLRPGLHVVKAVTPTGAIQEFRVQIVSGKESPPRRLAWDAVASPLR